MEPQRGEVKTEKLCVSIHWGIRQPLQRDEFGQTSFKKKKKDQAGIGSYINGYRYEWLAFLFHCCIIDAKPGNQDINWSQNPMIGEKNCMAKCNVLPEIKKIESYRE